MSLEDLPNEEWRFIPDTDALYMVSSLGRIKSVDSLRIYPNYQRNCKSKIIKQYPNWQGYLSCFVSNGKGKRFRVITHKIVCNVFIPNPDNFPCVNHKDENKQNNRVENLEHCTYSYNLMYGSRAHIRDVSVLQYDLQGNFIKEFSCVKDAAIATGAQTRAISNATHGRAKSAGGFIWKIKKDGNNYVVPSYRDDNKKGVVCFDLRGKLIGEYESLIDAEIL